MLAQGSACNCYKAAVAQALLPVSKADASRAEGTGKSACATALVLPSRVAPIRREQLIVARGRHMMIQNRAALESVAHR